MNSAKIALVTGANKGLGKAIAYGLGKKGFRVLIGSRDRDNGEAVVSEFQREGIHADAVALDVTKDSSVLAASTWIASHFGKLDVLVNNAGALFERLPPSEASLSAMKKTYQTNVLGPIRMIQAMLPLLRQADAGRVVNMSTALGSLAGHSNPEWEYAGINMLAYCSSKTALNAVTVLFAKELRDTPIKVNAADPGHCATDLNGNSAPRTAAQGAIAAIRLATLPAEGPSGGFFNEDGPVAW